MVGNVLQHCHQPPRADGVGQGGQGRAAEGGQCPAGQLEAREACQLVAGRHEHGQLGCVGQGAPSLFHLRNERRHGLEPFLLHQQRKGLHATREGAFDDLARLGNEQRALGFQLAAQLRLGQPCEGVEARIVERVYANKGHGSS